MCDVCLKSKTNTLLFSSQLWHKLTSIEGDYIKSIALFGFHILTNVQDLQPFSGQLN